MLIVGGGVIALAGTIPPEVAGVDGCGPTGGFTGGNCGVGIWRAPELGDTAALALELPTG